MTVGKDNKMKFYWKTLDGQEGEIERFCEEELQVKRVSYKERLYAQYTNCEITKEELTEKLLKHEQKLEKRRKYTKGEIITSLDVLVQQDFVYIGEKIYNRGWFLSMQARLVDMYVKKGWVYMAIKKENK